MRLSQQENRMKSRLKYYTRSKLLIIDELVFYCYISEMNDYYQ